MVAHNSKNNRLRRVAAFLLWTFPLATGSSAWALPAGEFIARQPVSAHIEQLLSSGALPETRVALDRYSLIDFYEQRLHRPAWSDARGVDRNARLWLSTLTDIRRQNGDDPALHIDEIEQQLNAAGPAELAALDLLLSDSFIQYVRLRSAEIDDPRDSGIDWEIPKPRLDAVALLQEALTDGGIRQVVNSLQPRHQAYHRLQDKLAGYLLEQDLGGWPEFAARGAKLEAGSDSEEVPLLRRLLWATGDLTEYALQDSRYDAVVEQAVRSFQQRHGLEVDGVVGKRTRLALAVPLEQRIEQIRVNLQRWQWLPRDLGERYITVNTAAFELQVHDGDAVPLSMRVIVGKKQRETPVFMEKMRYLVVNPYWRVPSKIAREDLIPELLRDPAYFQQRNIRVLSGWDRDAEEIDPSLVRWQDYLHEDAYLPYQLRQDPGPANSLGRVKFMLPNRHSIYLHDTPARHLFDKPVRAFSSGCIRVEKPLALADYVLGGGTGGRSIEDYIASGETLSVVLPEPIPVYMLYQTAWVDARGMMNFRDDHYLRDARVAATLPALAAGRAVASDVKKASVVPAAVTLLQATESARAIVNQ